MNEIKVFSAACVLGGFLRLISSFVDSGAATDYTEVLYSVIDLCFILGLIGFYLLYRTNLVWVGHIGFTLAICGFGFIAGPETNIFGVAVYQLGSPIVGAGVLLLSANLIKAKLCGLVAPLSLVCSVIIGLVSMLVGSNLLFIVSGVLFGIGFMALGMQVWRNC